MTSRREALRRSATPPRGACQSPRATPEMKKEFERDWCKGLRKAGVAPGRFVRRCHDIQGARISAADGAGPLERADRARPDGRFVTYGIGVPLMDMRSPEVARAVVPVD